MIKKNLDKAALFAEADKLTNAISHGRVLTGRDEKLLDDHYRPALAYTSTALDGNALTEREARELLRNGLAVGGKPLRDHNAVFGHAKSFDFLLNYAKLKPLTLSEELINQIHLLYYAGIDTESAGTYKREQNYIEGTEYTPPSPKVTPMLMRTYINDMNRQKDAYHPVEYAIILHKRLLDIHPFSGGNGPAARLLMNLIFKTAGYGYCLVPPSARDDYMEAIRTAQLQNDSTPLVCLVAGCLTESLHVSARVLNVAL
jgi:Fic family protein